MKVFTHYFATFSQRSVSASEPLPLNQAKSKKKLELIQGLRGLAAFLVVLFHATELSNRKFDQSLLFNLFKFGSSGVDFFFVLSGFIIFFIHGSEIGQPHKLKSFLYKRFIRIYPLYWLITLAVLPIYFLVPSFGNGYERNLGVIIKSLLLYPQEHFPILIVGWSLSYEIFFYFIFCLVMLLKPQLSRRIIGTWLLVTLLFFSLDLLYGLEINGSPLFNLIFSAHNLEFALGILAAYLVRQYQLKQGRLLLITGVAAFLISGITQDYNLFAINGIITYGISSMLIIIGAASIDINQLSKIPDILDRLGDASYSLYLMHYPCLSVLVKLAAALNLVGIFGLLPIMSLFVVATTLLGIMMYVYLEKPLLQLLRRRLVFNH